MRKATTRWSAARARVLRRAQSPKHRHPSLRLRLPSLPIPGRAARFDSCDRSPARSPACGASPTTPARLGEGRAPTMLLIDRNIVDRLQQATEPGDLYGFLESAVELEHA